jgi:hypothetical protein
VPSRRQCRRTTITKFVEIQAQNHKSNPGRVVSQTERQ